MSCLLKVDGLGFTAPDGTTLLQDISFALHQDETLAVVGPSGSGKTTLLRCLNRLTEPTTGLLRLHEQDYNDIPVTELRRRIGMVFQLPVLFPGTVADNAAYGPGLRDDEEGKLRALKALEAVGLADRADQRAETLSVGQAQRLCLARALANDPEVLLLDEPTASLDREMAGVMEELLLRLRRDWGLAWVIVSHDEAQGLRLADRAIRLKDGAVVAEGPASQVLRVASPDGGSRSSIASSKNAKGAKMKTGEVPGGSGQ